MCEARQVHTCMDACTHALDSQHEQPHNHYEQCTVGEHKQTEHKTASMAARGACCCTVGFGWPFALGIHPVLNILLPLLHVCLMVSALHGNGNHAGTSLVSSTMVYFVIFHQYILLRYYTATLSLCRRQWT